MSILSGQPIQVMGEEGKFFTVVALSSELSGSATLPADIEDTQDVLLCGRCKAQFCQVEDFVSHKRTCNSSNKNNSSFLADHISEQSFYAEINAQNQILFLERGPVLYLPDASHISAQSPIHRDANQEPRSAFTDPSQAEATTTSAQTVGAGKRHTCVYCQKSFKKVFDLSQHVRCHTGEKPFQCVVCGRGFAQRSNVKKHLATHRVWPKELATHHAQGPPRFKQNGDTAVKSNPPALDTRQDHGDKALPVGSIQQDPEVDRALGCFSSLADESRQEVGCSNLENADHSRSLPPPVLEEGEEEALFGTAAQTYFKCSLCLKQFSKNRYSDYRVHLRSHLGEKCYRCTVSGCGRFFKLAADFVAHVRSHSDLEYRCHVCSDRFTDLNDLNLHQYTHLTDRETRERQVFECDRCRSRYASLEALDYHRETDLHSYPCTLCERDFVTERAMRKHTGSVHNEGPGFECDVCSKKLRSEHYLKAHLLIHSGELPFPCDECEARFNRKDKLKRHLLSHNVVKKFKCPFREHMNCGKEFHRLDKLKLHIMTHGSMKPFRCEECEQGFTRKEHLRTHVAKLHSSAGSARKLRTKGDAKKKSKSDNTLCHL